MNEGQESLSAQQHIGPVTAQEERLAADVKRFRIVAIIAAVLLLPQMIAHLFVSVNVIPIFERMFADMGGELPVATQMLVSMGPALGILLLVLDALIFWTCYRLARRYWIGLLFVPLFAVGALSGLLVEALYLPMSSVITLIE